jgi:PhnB protein
MQVHSYLNFNGRCEEAIEFYKKAVGAQVQMMMRFKEAPPSPDYKPAPGTENKIMHSSMRIGDTEVMASDGRCTGASQKFEGISLTLNPPTEPEAQKLFKALSTGGNVQVPLTKTFFSPAFGVLTDPFGVTWMVMVEEKK